MLNIIQPIPPSLERFSSNFEKVLGKHQLKNLQVYLLGLSLELKRKNLQSVDNSRIKGNYDSLHHFLSQSPWDEEKLNEKRLELIQKDRRTRTSQKGSLIFDDTGCKKTGECTEGVKPQRLGSEGRIANCNVVVTSHYVDEIRDYPVGLAPYTPEDKLEGKSSSEFHTKIDLLIRLAEDALQKGIQFEEILFDNWYLCKRTVEFCERRDLHWFSNLKRNDILYRPRRRRKGKKVKRHGRKKIRKYHKVKEKMRVEELVNSLPPSYFSQMVKVYKDGKEQIRYIWGANFKVSFLDDIKRVVISKPNPYTMDMDKIDVYVTDNLSLGDKEIVLHISKRWKIEDFYRDAKDNLGFDQYQVRSLREIKRHWYLVFLVYSYLKISKLKGAFQRVFKPDISLDTIGDLLKVMRCISFLYFCRWLKDHYDVLLEYLQVKEPIFA